MRYLALENILVGQNVTWSGGFPSLMSPCFYYGRPIKFNTGIYSLRFFFAKTARTILMTQNEGCSHFLNAINISTTSMLYKDSICACTWSNPCEICIALIIFSMRDFPRFFRWLGFNFYVLMVYNVSK
jgi:hypothetical protein